MRNSSAGEGVNQGSSGKPCLRRLVTVTPESHTCMFIPKRASDDW